MTTTDFLDMGALVRQVLAASSRPDPDAGRLDRPEGRLPVPVPLTGFESAFSTFMSDLGMGLDSFLERMVRPYLERAPFAASGGKGWVLVPEGLRTHGVAEGILNETESCMVEQKLRSAVAKRLGQKVRDTHFWLALDPTFRADPIQPEHVRGRGKVWGLANWRLVNDAAVRVLERSGPQRAKDLLVKAVVEARLREGLRPVFSPELDKRLVADGGRWNIKRPERAVVAPPTSRLETRLQGEILESVERLLAECPDTTSISREEILGRLLGAQAMSQRGGPYLKILDEVMAAAEGRGEIVRVRFDAGNPWWRKAGGFPTTAPEVAARIACSTPDETLLVGDDGLPGDLLDNLSDPHLYWLDGDFAEDAFPGVEPLLVLTLNDFLDDRVSNFPRPLANAIRASLGVEGRWAEFVVETPGGEEVVALCDYENHQIQGLAGWINRSAESGSVFALEYRGEGRFRLDLIGNVGTPHLEDAEIEYLLRCQEEAPEAVAGLLQAVLKYYPEGLSFNDLFHRTLFIRRHSRRELMSALVTSFLFESRGGRWRQHENRAAMGSRLSAVCVAVAGVSRRTWLLLASPPAEGDALTLPSPHSPAAPAPAPGDVVGLVADGGVSRGGMALAGQKGRKGLVATRVLTWELPAAAEAELTPGARLVEVDPGDLHDLLLQGENSLVDSEVRAGLRQAFHRFSPEVVINQAAQRSLEEVEALLDEGGGGLGSLAGIAWQLNEDFSWKAFQKVLDEKFYSREDAVRMDTQAMASWLAQRPIAWDAPTLVLPTGAGELPVAILDALLNLVAEADYIASEEGLALRTPQGREFLFGWSRLISNERRIAKILAKDEALGVEEFLRGWFRHVASLVDPRKLHTLISRLSLHLRGLPGLEVEEAGLTEFFTAARKAARSASLGESTAPTRFSTALADLRGLGAKDIKSALRQIPTTMAQGGTLIIITGPGQRVKSTAGTLESEVNLGSVTARSYSL